MSARYWIIAFALGLIASLGQAQEQSQKPRLTTQQEHTPTGPFPIPVPVDIVEDQSTIEARQRVEEEAREREMRDLAAQEGMNAATQAIKQATLDMRDFSLYSTILVGVGTALLFVTLWLTRQANRAAQAAVDVTREIGEKQVRAYPSVTSVHVGGITNGLPNIIIKISNSGNSPALRMNCRGRIMLAYQEDIPTEGATAQCGMEISAVSFSQVAVSPNSEGEAEVYVPHSDDTERQNTMKEMASTAPRKNPYWSVNIFVDWVDVFDTEYSFYINAGQLPNNRRRNVVGKENAMSELVLKDPFKISFQSESRQSGKN